MFFILPMEQANRFIRRLIRDESFDFNKPPDSELGLSAMQEMGNILSGSYLSALSDFTGFKDLSHSARVKCRYVWCNY